MALPLATPREYEELHCLLKAPGKFNSWASSLPTDTLGRSQEIRVDPASYGGKKRLLPPFLEAISLAVLGPHRICGFFREILAQFPAEAAAASSGGLLSSIGSMLR